MRAVWCSENSSTSAVRHPEVSGAGPPRSLSGSWQKQSGPEPAHKGGGSSRFPLPRIPEPRKGCPPQGGPGPVCNGNAPLRSGSAPLRSGSAPLRSRSAPLCSGNALVGLQRPGTGASRLRASDAPLSLASGGSLAVKVFLPEGLYHSKLGRRPGCVHPWLHSLWFLSLPKRCVTPGQYLGLILRDSDVSEVWMSGFFKAFQMTLTYRRSWETPPRLKAERFRDTKEPGVTSVLLSLTTISWSPFIKCWQDAKLWTHLRSQWFALSQRLGKQRLREVKGFAQVYTARFGLNSDPCHPTACAPTCLPVCPRPPLFCRHVTEGLGNERSLSLNAALFKRWMRERRRIPGSEEKRRESPRPQSGAQRAVGKAGLSRAPPWLWWQRQVSHDQTPPSGTVRSAWRSLETLGHLQGTAGSVREQEMWKQRNWCYL